MAYIPISVDNIKDLQKLAEFPGLYPDGVALSPDNQHLACNSYSVVTLLNYETGEETGQLHGGKTERLIPIEYDPEGKYLACIGEDALYIWSVENNLLFFKWPCHFGGRYPAFIKRTDTYLFVIGTEQILVLDTFQRKAVGKFEFSRGPFSYPAIAPAGNRIAWISGSMTRNENSVAVVWNVQRGRVEWSQHVDAQGCLKSVQFHPSGDLLWEKKIV